MFRARLAGLLLMAGFALVILSSFIGPPGLYQEPDLDVRLAMIQAHPANWLAANLVFAVAVLGSAGGLVLFSMALDGKGTRWMRAFANAAIVAGGAAFAIHLGLRQFLPGEYVERLTPFSLGAFWLTSLGLLAFGMVFLRAGLARWLVTLFIAGPILFMALALIFGRTFYFNFPPQSFYLLTLIAGLVLLRWKKPH